MDERTCSIEGCENRTSSRGWCNMHYCRWKRHGDPSIVKPSGGSCSVQECDRPVQGRGWCKMHWKRWRTHGDPEYVRPAAPTVSCRVDDCGKPKHGDGYCTMHYQRVVKYGDPHKVGPRSPGRNRLDIPSYDGMHKRLFYDRGRASAQPCVDCGNRAHEWSYSGGCPNEAWGEVRGSVLAYSTDQSRYSPRCRPCHRSRDLSLARGRDDAGRWAAVTS